MKYYQLKLSSRNENIKDELSEGLKYILKLMEVKLQIVMGIYLVVVVSGRYFLKTMLMMLPYLITSIYTVYPTKKNTIGFY